VSAQPLRTLSEEEYLESERAAEFKSEYYDGRMYGMAGASYAHAQTVMNLASELREALRGRCRVTASDVRVRIPATRTYTYPDVAVVCGAPRFADDQRDTLINPILIVEVLSPGTEALDRGYKFSRYRALESLTEYVLVSQDGASVEVYRREPEGRWTYSAFEGLEATCRFESVDCAIPLAVIYDQVTFPNPELPAA
jgi:Uma2 family endonuclease